MPQGDLLRPSLKAANGARRSIYPAMVGYLSGFFGGPVAAAIVAMVNSFRLGRLGRDWPLAVAGAVMAAALLLPEPWGVAGRIEAWAGDSGTKVVLRLAGMGVFGVAYMLHGRYHRGMDVVGIKAPSGWVLGILATLAGILSSVLLVAMGGK